MNPVDEEVVPIDHGLRFVLLGLECAFGVSFAAAECERVFRDAESDQVSAKQYEFYSSPSLSISGRVDEYEPEEIWISAKGARNCDEVLKRVVEAARFAEVRYRRHIERGNA